MSALSLDVHGVRVRVASSETGTIESLRRDFAFFEAQTGEPAAARLSLARRKPDGARPRGLATLRTREYAAYDDGAVRTIRYRDGPAAVFDFSREEGRIDCEDPRRLHELAYLAVLSRCGEALDLRGLHRVHALGFEWDGRGGLLLLPSGGGKSVTALELLRRTRFGILSDDTPILDAGARLEAFPLRWGFLPSADLSGIPREMLRPMHRRRFGLKWLLDVEYFRDRVRGGVPLRWVLLGERGQRASPSLAPCSRAAAAAALAANLVVGVGVAQMSEYMLRPSAGGPLRLARIAAARARAAWAALRAAETFRFFMTSRPADNAAALEAFVGQGAGS